MVAITRRSVNYPTMSQLHIWQQPPNVECACFTPHINHARNLVKIKEIRRFRKTIRRFDRLRGQQVKDCCTEVTPAQSHFLMELEESGPITSGDLARVLNVDASTLTRTADRLVGRNLILRETHPNDRRALLISLTENTPVEVCGSVLN